MFVGSLHERSRLQHAGEPAGDDFFGFADDARDQLGDGRDVVDETRYLTGGPDAGLELARLEEPSPTPFLKTRAVLRSVR